MGESDYVDPHDGAIPGQAYGVPYPPMMPEVVRPRSYRITFLVGLVLMLLIGGVGVAFAVSYRSTDRICDRASSMRESSGSNGSGNASDSGGSGIPSPREVRGVADDIKSDANLIWTNMGLREAAQGLADDMFDLAVLLENIRRGDSGIISAIASVEAIKESRERHVKTILDECR